MTLEGSFINTLLHGCSSSRIISLERFETKLTRHKKDVVDPGWILVAIVSDRVPIVVTRDSSGAYTGNPRGRSPRIKCQPARLRMSQEARLGYA